MTHKCNILNYWYAPNFVRIAGEYHITTMFQWQVRSHACNAAGRATMGASAPFYNRGEWSSTEQGEREIAPISPAQCCEANQSL